MSYRFYGLLPVYSAVPNAVSSAKVNIYVVYASINLTPSLCLKFRCNVMCFDQARNPCPDDLEAVVNVKSLQPQSGQ
jgi:hypothetical protein